MFDWNHINKSEKIQLITAANFLSELAKQMCSFIDINHHFSWHG